MERVVRDRLARTRLRTARDVSRCGVSRRHARVSAGDPHDDAAVYAAAFRARRSSGQSCGCSSEMRAWCLAISGMTRIWPCRPRWSGMRTLSCASMRHGRSGDFAHAQDTKASRSAASTETEALTVAGSPTSCSARPAIVEPTACGPAANKSFRPARPALFGRTDHAAGADAASPPSAHFR